MRMKTILLFLSVLLILLAGCGNQTEKQTENLLETVKEYKGYMREIGQEEYDFYTYFVRRELPDEVSTQELEEKVKVYANEINALFYLAGRLGLSEPYSYEGLKMRMEQENELRKYKKEKGEAFYGPEQFTLEQFFQYTKDITEANLRTYIEGYTDNAVIENAKTYYEENKEKFRLREAVTYEVTQKDSTETITADRTQLNILANADPALADFLEAGQENELYEDLQSDGKRMVIIQEIRYNESGFVANKEAAVSAYIQQQLYPKLLQIIAENNPVSFRLEINE